MIIEKFIVKNSTILITQSVSTLQDLRDQVSAAPDPDNIAAYSELVRASSTAIENLNKACPNHLGDWYFTGNYPTSGGNKVANRSFMNYVDGIKRRAY